MFKKRLRCALLAAALLAGFCPAALATSDNAAAQGEYAPGEAVVLYAPQNDGWARASNSVFGEGITVRSTLHFGHPTLLSAAMDQTDAQASALSVAHVSASMDTGALIDTLNALPYVYAAEPNYIYTPAADFNDPYYTYGLQWALNGENGVHPEGVWDALDSSADPIVIAVVDTGVEYDHPDLASCLNEAAAMAFDAYPYINGRTKLGEEINTSGHGTAMAGVIAATANNAAGIAGVTGAGRVTIMPVQVYANDTTAYLSDIVAGIHHIIQKKNSGINVVAANMSLGGSWHSSTVTSYALGQLTEAGILPVRAAGNYGRNINDVSVYPSVYEAPGVVGVAAIEENGSFDNRLAGSNSNYSVDCIQLAAPGGDVLSTYLTDAYGYLNTAALGSDGCDSYDGFENETIYDLTVGSSGGTQALQLTPEPGGRAGKCLRLILPNAVKGTVYQITLLPAQANIPTGNSLGMQLRIQCSDGKYMAFSIGEEYLPGHSWSRTNNDPWYSWSGRAMGAGVTTPMYLWLQPNSDGYFAVSIDDFGTAGPDKAAYTVASGTSMAAPYVSGAYGLLCLADPDMTLAERRARLIGSTRTETAPVYPYNALVDRVNAGGSLDLRTALAVDTAAFCPVMDSITQSGRTVTVNGWFFGDAPALSLGGRAVRATSQTGNSGACTMTFTLPSGLSGVQTLTLTKSNGRSYRMRYRYNADGNMQEVCDGPLGAIRTVLFSNNTDLFALCSTDTGFTVYRLAGNGWVQAAVLNEAVRTARTDFTFCVGNGRLHVYDYDHVHSLDLSAMGWSTIDGPDALQPTDTGCTLGAINDYDGQLMILGGSYYTGTPRTRAYRTGPVFYDANARQWVNGPVCSDGMKLGAAQAVEVNGTLVAFVKDTSRSPSRDRVLLFGGTRWTVRPAAYDVSGCTLGVLDGKVLCFGDAGAQNGVLRYDPVTGRWSRLPYWGTGLPYSGVGTVLNGSLYVLTALQDHSRFILQTVKPTSPAYDVDAANSTADPFFPQPTPTPVPVADIPPTGAAQGGWVLPFLLGLGLLWGIKKRPKGRLEE